MPVKQEKADGLKALLGEELAAQILADAEKASTALEGAGINFKEDAAEEEEEEEEKKVPEEEAEEEKKVPEEEEEEEEKEQLFELEMDDELLGEIAKHVPVKELIAQSIKELLPQAIKDAMGAYSTQLAVAVKEAIAESTVASKEQVVQDALAGRIKLTPYTASKSNDNLVPEDVVAEANKAKKREEGDVVSILAKRMLAGEV